MLKGIHPILNADILHALRAMGHGDEIVDFGWELSRRYSCEAPHMYGSQQSRPHAARRAVCHAGGR